MSVSTFMEQHHKGFIFGLTGALVAFVIICSTPLSFICEWLFRCGM